MHEPQFFVNQWPNLGKVNPLFIKIIVIKELSQFY